MPSCDWRVQDMPDGVWRLPVFVIRILVLCPDGHGEATPEEIDHVKLMVETLVSLALLQLFPMVNVEMVDVAYKPAEQP